MKKKENPVTKMFPEFKDQPGKCSLEAIAFTFKLDLHAIKRVFKMTGWKGGGDGTTYHQCDKAIRILGDIHLRTVRYHRNYPKGGITVNEFLHSFPKGVFLLNQEGHIAAIRNGVAYDNYTPTNYRLLGWWEITRKYETPLCNPRPLVFKRINTTHFSLGFNKSPIPIWKK